MIPDIPLRPIAIFYSDQSLLAPCRVLHHVVIIIITHNANSLLLSNCRRLGMVTSVVCLKF